MAFERQFILVADDDEAINEALAMTLERDGRTVILCSDVDAAEIAVTHFPITHLVTDVQFTGEFGFEGLHSLERIRALSPHCRIVLMTGQYSEALRKNAISHGAACVLAKPFDTDDLEEALRGPDAVDEWDSAPYEVLRIPSIEEILRSDALNIAFQPIVRLRGDSTVTFAYEALTRIRGHWLTGGPASLFEYAQRRGKLAELNLLTMRRAIESAVTLPKDVSIFINIDPLAFRHPRLLSDLLEETLFSGIAPERIVLEVTERSGFAADTPDPVFDDLHAAGVRFALDDHGSAHSHLEQIGRIRPSFIKISNTIGTAFELDETKKRIVRHTLALASDFGCETILEGVESGATARAAADTGVPLAQGFYFSRARAASHWMGSKKVRERSIAC